MEKANKVLWLVKAQDEMDLAELATDPDTAEHHHQRAMRFQGFANQECPPDYNLDGDIY